MPANEIIKATRYKLIFDENKQPLVTSNTEVKMVEMFDGKNSLIAAPMQEKITTKLQICIVDADASEMLLIIPSENGMRARVINAHFGRKIILMTIIDTMLDIMQDANIKNPAVEFRNIPLPTATITKAGPGLTQNINSIFAVLLSIILSLYSIAISLLPTG